MSGIRRLRGTSADVRQRLGSRPDGSSLHPGDIPALPDWGIAEGDVDGFLEMVWHSSDNGVSDLGRGRVRPQYWESIQGFSRDGLDLAGLTAAMIRDPDFEARNGRATAAPRIPSRDRRKEVGGWRVKGGRVAVPDLPAPRRVPSHLSELACEAHIPGRPARMEYARAKW